MYNEKKIFVFRLKKSLNCNKNGGIEHSKASIKLIPLKEQTRK